MFVSEKNCEKKIITLFYIILLWTGSDLSDNRKERSNFFSCRWDENNYIVRHNYALDGDNGMKNNMHNVFSKGGREGRISLKYINYLTRILHSASFSCTRRKNIYASTHNY